MGTENKEVDGEEESPGTYEVILELGLKTRERRRRQQITSSHSFKI